MKKQIKIIPTKEYSEAEINEIAFELINWLKEKDDHIFIDDFLFTKKFIHPKDVEYFIQINKNFSETMDQANAIELAKLKKFSAGDRLNATIVKQILINKHNWL